MGIVYETLDSCSDIDKDRFGDENWYLMAWGMGDAMNMVLFLEGQSPVSYKILCLLCLQSLYLFGSSYKL